MSHDYAQYLEKLDGDQLTQLSGLVRKLRDADKAVSILENQLKEAAARSKVLREQMIPDFMTNCGIKQVATDDGNIKLREEVRASFPKDPERAEAAYAWLKEAGHDDLVKRQFVISFGKGEEKWADEFERKLRGEERPLKVDRKKSIHHQTLCAFLREQLEEGTDVPLDLFGAFIQKFAEIKQD